MARDRFSNQPVRRPVNKPVRGCIKLYGELVKCELIRKNQSGPLVQLLEGIKAYSVGDKVQVGHGEFVKDD